MKQKLKCHVLDGCFSDERVVVLRLWNGERYSEFVPAAEVTGDIDTDGELSVDVYRDNGTTWAVLPTEYRDMVAVNEADLVAS